MSIPPHRRWFQVDLKGLLIGIALIAIGLAALRCMVLNSRGPYTDISLNLCLWFIGLPFIGAGVLFPFRRPLIGCAIGLTVEVAVSMAVIYLEF
jgi:hypothetical protein